jgi:hypothetical protein
MFKSPDRPVNPPKRFERLEPFEQFERPFLLGE